MHVDVNKYQRGMTRHPQEFYMRNFKDLTSYEQEVLIFTEAQKLMQILTSDLDSRISGLESMAVDLDCLIYMGDHNTKRFGEMEDDFVKSLMKEATYRVSGTSVPSDMVIRY